LGSTPQGIPGRPWFQHLLYSSRYTYALFGIPGLTEGVEKQDWKLAGQQAALLEKALKKEHGTFALGSILRGEKQLNDSSFFFGDISPFFPVRW